MNHQTTHFPDGFFDRQDDSADERFYSIQRLVTHIDAGAIAAVGSLYEELGLTDDNAKICLLYTSPSPRDRTRSRMPSSA